MLLFIVHYNNIFYFMHQIAEKRSPTEWVLTFLRCTVKDEGCYIIKAINNIGSDAKSWKIVVVAAQQNMLLHESENLPGGNQFLSQNKNNVQRSDTNSITEVVEVRISYTLYMLHHLSLYNVPKLFEICIKFCILQYII